MKQDFPVLAHRAEIAPDRNKNLMGTLELQVPFEHLDFLREAHVEQEHGDVRFNLVVANKTTGEFRRIGFQSKGSKMKDFLPVAVLTKFHSTSDDLGALFDASTYALTLYVEIVEARGLFDGPEEEAAPAGPAPTPAWVLAELELDERARERMLAEGCPHCPDLHDELAADLVFTAAAPSNLVLGAP